MAPRPRPKVVALEAPGTGMRALKQAQQNAREVDALLQTAVGALHDLRLVLQRMRALAMLAADVSHGDAARTGLQAQLSQLVREVERTATSAAFNAQKLLDGSLAGGMTFQLGADALAFALPSTTPAALALTDASGGRALSVGARAEAQRAVSVIEAAIEIVSARQAELVAVIGRLDVIMVNLHVGAENYAAIMSRITDRDMAAAVTNVLKAQIVRTPAAALQAQAQPPHAQGVLVQFRVPPSP